MAPITFTVVNLQLLSLIPRSSTSFNFLFVSIEEALYQTSHIVALEKLVRVIIRNQVWMLLD